MTEQYGTILIADDEDTIRQILLQKLSQEGYQCQEAINSNQVLNGMKECPCDLILLDINMPGKSGVELLHEIRARYPDTAVLMATAVNDISTAIQCLKQGACDYLTKPFNLSELLFSIERALEKRRLEIEIRDYRQHLEQKVDEQTKSIREAFLNSVKSLAYALEAKDKYTIGHSQRVTEIAILIADALGMTQESIEKIKLAGLIHDIGKIGIRESILDKPGQLTEEEYQHIKSHPDIGERILSPIIEDKEVLFMVKHHHERYDGKGYPDGLKAENIPVGARILAIADSYDAMTSARPYRDVMSTEAACYEIARCKATQFDPVIADSFLRVQKCIPSIA